MKKVSLNNINAIAFTLCICTFIASAGCKKLIEVDPPVNVITSSNIYGTDLTAASVLTGLLTEISQENFQSISVKMGLYSDELVSIPANPLYEKLYSNSLYDEGNQLFWTPYYRYIFRANSAIEGLSLSNTLSSQVKSQLLGEAKYLRAFFYFYLVNLYGDVPLILTTDPQINKSASRVSQSIIYDQIVADLKEAEVLLSTSYVGGDIKESATDKRRPSKAVATALLARVYLFHKDWKLAADEATKLIGDSRFAMESLSQTFKVDSKETIWSVQPLIIGENVQDAKSLVLKSASGLPSGPNLDRPIYLSSNIDGKFETGDQRRSIWVDTAQVVENGTGTILNVYPFAFKYQAWKINQPRTEYLVVLRLAEQYLIRAEARAQLGNLGEAADDLFIVRQRAGLNRIAFTSLDDAITKILAERRSEFFTEFGHRWFDLKRTGRLTQVMTDVAPVKGGTWNTSKALLPIPLDDIRNNPNLRGHQNPGYLEF